MGSSLGASSGTFAHHGSRFVERRGDRPAEPSGGGQCLDSEGEIGIARHEIVKLERGLVVLEIIVGIAPLLGLVGTIIGMMATFENVGQMGLNDASKLAQGISVILKATLIGLLIAIPALVSWSYYSKKVEMLAVEMETLCDEFMRRLYREEKK